MVKEYRFQSTAEEIRCESRKSHMKAAEMAEAVRGEAQAYIQALPHIEDKPPLTTDDRMYDWYYVSDPEELAAVKLALYDPDGTAFDQEIDQYPTWILAVSDSEGYGDIDLHSAEEMIEMYSKYIGKLVSQMIACVQRK
ncbi:MAG: hypothetical protein LUE86_05015 [Clostridiales bacterium]|nr:hypothetical protein [Clostridiales bacterium]